MLEIKQCSVALPTVRRLPSYLRIIKDFQETGQQYISSTIIAERLQLEPIQVRKDLAAVGIGGHPRLGFAINDLLKAIIHFLGWDNTTDAFIIGAGNLGSALAGYQGFTDYGLNIIAAFDVDEKKISTLIHGREIFHMDRLPELARRLNVHIGILTLPADFAQNATDALIASGITAIWNFTPVKLIVPEDVIVEKIDLAASLAVLSRTLQKKIRSATGAA